MPPSMAKDVSHCGCQPVSRTRCWRSWTRTAREPLRIMASPMSFGLPVMTDSISPPDRAGDGGKIRYVSCDRLIGEAIRRIANEESVSKLFD